MRYFSPHSAEEAVEALASGPFTILAGGTDVYPSLRDRPAPADILDISRIAELRGIEHSGDCWRFGATTTWTSVARAKLPPAFHGLQAAAREVGSAQIQNAGTIAGNICNASPAADGVPPLLSLDARVEILSPQGRRTVPLSDFIKGVRSIDLHPGELVTAILIPDIDARSAFLKLGARRYLVISIAMVACTIETAADGRVKAARIAVGACSPVARRLPGLEAALAGLPMEGGALAAAVRSDHLSVLSPIDDVRADGAYRREVVEELVKRALQQALGSAREMAA
ncbi:xanthine dehydrogenase [Metarhizobium album]|uniref:Xanthine dehydrogenase n=1 Tax=Metarhizobium album TaxID=2182425 RepID=A0A2U2DRG0_9HYPH|nr:xanthine dehydrogenase [Rhizobium album]